MGDAWQDSVTDLKWLHGIVKKKMDNCKKKYDEYIEM